MPPPAIITRTLRTMHRHEHSAATASGLERFQTACPSDQSSDVAMACVSPDGARARRSKYGHYRCQLRLRSVRLQGPPLEPSRQRVERMAFNQLPTT